MATDRTHAQRQARYRQSLSRLSYRQALCWLAHNDDCQWTFNDGPVSVTAGFIADAYGKDTDGVSADIRAILGSEEDYLDTLAERE